MDATWLTTFLDAPEGMALKAALAAMFLDWITGTLAALRDGTFSLDAWAAFLRKHGIRVAILSALLLVGYFGGASGAPFLAAAVAGLVAYAGETAASVLGNLNPPKESDVKAETAASLANPVPTE
jgi:hypothetical protein